MKANEIIRKLMKDSGTTLMELAEYADMGSKENVCHILQRKDLKVGSFVKMLEVMGYKLVVIGDETNTEYDVDYEEEVY